MRKKRNEQEMKNTMSRRKFLSASGLAVGAVGMGMLTGCGGDSNVDIYTTGSGSGSSNLPASWDETSEFVFIGFGGAAAFAAVHLSKLEPSAKITILEAQAAGGGSTKICGGSTYMGGGTGSQIMNGYTETADQFYDHMMAAAGEGANSTILRAYADNSVATYNSLVDDFGLNYSGGCDEGYVMSPADSNDVIYFDGERRPELLAAAGLVTPVPHSHGPVPETGLSRAQTFWKAFEEKTLALSNVTITVKTEVKKLIVDNDRVVGVMAVQGGVNKYYKATKAVLICTGGFIKNDEMVAQFLPYALRCDRNGNSMDTGTGIKMAQEIGADVQLMNAAEDFFPVYYKHVNLIESIAVTPNGVRYAPEDIASTRMGALSARQYPLTYLIFDDNLMKSMPQQVQNLYFPDVKTGNTIAELAANAGIPAASLEATVNVWNLDCANSTDSQYGKHADLLRPIATPPFYAEPRLSTQVFTLSCGGLRINEKAQVMKADGSVITGLYAAGATTAHINAEFYLLGGGTGGAFTFGRIAGREMSNENSWE